MAQFLGRAHPAADGPVRPNANETGGALVRLIAPVYGDENAGQAERRLAEFARAIVPVLGEYHLK